MGIDDSFKRAGAVPFVWEIEPGVPKLYQNQPSSTPALKPPPASTGQPTSRFRSKSVRTRTNRDRLDWSSSKEVSNGLPGCFTPMLTRRSEKKRDEETETEVDYSSDSETLSRCSTSTGKTIASSRDSVSSSSSISSCFGSSTPFSSIRSSPQMAASDAMGSWRLILEKWKI